MKIVILFHYDQTLPERYPSMRIAKLQQDNRRMQGEARREWYRQHSERHMREVTRLVRLAVARCGAHGRGAVVVLGAGACTELPLEWLARQGLALTLVDVDAQGMVNARDELSVQRRAQVNLAQADLTGGVSQALEGELLAHPWAELARLGPSAEKSLLDSAALCLERCPVPDPPRLPELSPHSYDVVLSDRALTQLFSLPLLDVVDTLLLYSRTAADLRESHPRYVAAAERFRRRVALAHLSLMRELARPGGSVLLLTDTHGYLLPPTSGPHAEDADALDLLPPSVLDPVTEMAARFDHVEVSDRWRWNVSAPTATSPGRAYDVVGFLGRARGENQA